MTFTPPPWMRNPLNNVPIKTPTFSYCYYFMSIMMHTTFWVVFILQLAALTLHTMILLPHSQLQIADGIRYYRNQYETDCEEL